MQMGVSTRECGHSRGAVDKPHPTESASGKRFYAFRLFSGSAFGKPLVEHFGGGGGEEPISFERTRYIS